MADGHDRGPARPETHTAGPCVAAQACRSYDRHTHHAADADTTPLCATCLTHAAAGVAVLAHDWRDLEQLLPKSISQWGDGQPGHCGEAPIPLRLDVEALQREIWWLTTAWADVLADRHRLADRPGRVRDGPAVVAAVRVLAPRVDQLARLDAVQMAGYPRVDDEVSTRYRSVTISYVSGARGVLDLGHAHQRARSMLGLTEPVYVLPGHCRSRGCGRAELRVKDGSDTVWCDHCGVSITRDDHDRHQSVFREAMEAA